MPEHATATTNRVKHKRMDLRRTKFASEITSEVDKLGGRILPGQFSGHMYVPGGANIFVGSHGGSRRSKVAQVVHPTTNAHPSAARLDRCYPPS